MKKGAYDAPFFNFRGPIESGMLPAIIAVIYGSNVKRDRFH